MVMQYRHINSFIHCPLLLLMSYLSDFERSFSDHTLRIIEGYKGPYSATILINCLLGLLVVPKETAMKALPKDGLSCVEQWGISPQCIKNPGKVGYKDKERVSSTVKDLVVNLRHAVAHFRIKPIPENQDVHSFVFTNDKGLDATIPIEQLRAFVEKLSKHLAKS